MWILKKHKGVESALTVLRENKGYFTIEASFIVPILCFLGIGIMMTGLYLCDLNQTKSFLHQKVVLLSEDDSDYSVKERNSDEGYLKGRLFVSHLERFSLSKTEKKVKGEAVLVMDMKIPFVGTWMGRVWRNTFSFHADVGNNTEQMRRWDQLE